MRTCIIGRRLFDLTNGWNGSNRVPSNGERVFVVTHEPPTDWPFPDAPFTFVNGIEEAVAQAQAFADVSITGGNITGQAIAAGLVDEVAYNLMPALLGTGIRFFGEYVGPESSSTTRASSKVTVSHICTTASAKGDRRSRSSNRGLFR
ncbi:dihydrofolate reductase [Kribbella aluminosa]|uniref:Dihydrofolate reductase n=1 Tax=Kribbella aluminosa TaxID=416017 RepID=A0ABS4UDY2_9ACTN|nr:hypothetical protein [Kribbella aluminosa]MBP2349852.1 dihydrofolate reductase [Kribbella aluminosa]